ncbi:MAG: RluA family pseudouridine synthase [Ruminococcus flavefaciens]|nr:RluA family pseudouridine synthase [Ruminococcus flavefaciens]MCM1060559.1 RluA family pseudouridine synthase [Eubacterium sp.]
MKKFTINNNDCDQRIDKFILKAMPDMPKGMLYKLIRKKDIKINGKRCEISTRLCEGDIVTVFVKDELSASKKHDMSFLNASGEPEIVYEDENILIADKPIGLDSHSSDLSGGDTLINRIKLYLYNKKEYYPESENSFAPAICSRLDRNTSGLVISAKNAASLREINSAIKDGAVHKIYRCICTNHPPKAADIIIAFHKKEESGNIVKISDFPADGYKEIKTGYKIIRQKKGLSLVEIRLFTGRTHQIRAHMSHIGSPLLGDGKYGDIQANKRYNTFCQQLCAYSLEFNLPETSPLSYLNKLDITAGIPDFEKKFF